MELGEQADAPSLVSFVIRDDPRAFLGNQLHGRFELRAAVASPAAKNISGETTGMHSGQDVIAAGDVAVDEGNVLAAVDS